MAILFHNLSCECEQIILEELRFLGLMNQPTTRELPALDFILIDLSRPYPAREASSGIRIRPAKQNKPVGFADRCAWECDRQSFQIITVSEKRFQVVGGGTEGVLYGFYTFLKRRTGVRWYTPSAEDVVFATPMEQPDTVSRPTIPLRGFEFSVRKHEHSFIIDYLRWMLRNGWNLLDLNAAEWEACPNRSKIASEAARMGIRLAVGGHAVSHFLPGSEFERHPELFGFRNGKRCPAEPGKSADVLNGAVRMRQIQPCYTNPATREYIVRTVCAFLEKYPEIDIFSLWPHDGANNWCQCSNCLKHTPYEMLYHLALDILERNKTVSIEMLCYADSLNLPSSKLPHNNRTYTLFCPYLRQHKHQIFAPGLDPGCLTIGNRYPEPAPVTPSDDREYGILFERWLPFMAGIGSELGIFSYYQLVFHDETGASDRSRFLYHPEPDLVAAEIKRFAECGIKVFYDCSPPYPGFWPDARFHTYLAALLWEPDSDLHAIINEYYLATLGSRASDVTAILETLAACLADRNAPGIPHEVTSKARDVFAAIPGTCGKRYLLWLDYIILADATRQEKLCARFEQAMVIEKKIGRFFKKHQSDLAGKLDVEWMKRYSQRAADYVEGFARKEISNIKNRTISV